jgi:hypothetical protein
MTLKELIDNAANETNDLFGLVFDDKPNLEQLDSFLAEGLQAWKALSAAVAALPAEKRAAAASHFVNGIHRGLNESLPFLSLE